MEALFRPDPATLGTLVALATTRDGPQFIDNAVTIDGYAERWSESMGNIQGFIFQNGTRNASMERHVGRDFVGATPRHYP